MINRLCNRGEPSLLAAYHSELQKYSPVYPIIKKKQLHTDIVNALKSRIRMEERSSMLVQAYIQMMLISEIRKNFFELDLFLNILLHIQHVHYKNLLILNINYPLFF